MRPIANTRSAAGIPTGRLAVWWVVASEIVIFGGLLVSYIMHRLGNPEWAQDSALDSVEGRLAGHDAIDEQLSTWTRDQDARRVMETLVTAGVPAGVVQAARPRGGCALMGCTVAPGFDFADFALNTPAELHRDFPAHRATIDLFF